MNVIYYIAFYIFVRMQNPKILVCAPTYSQKHYCEEEYFSRISCLSYKPYDIFIAENSRDKDYYFHLRTTYPHVKFKYLDPGRKSAQTTLALAHEICRTYAVGGNYDYMLHMETDIIPPVNIIELLLSHNKKIAGCTYFTGAGKDTALMIQGEAHLNNNEKFVYPLSHGAGSLMKGSLETVHSIGLGCILIHRSVFTQIKFRYEQGSDAYPDSFFALDAHDKGFKIHLDTSIVVTHRALPVYRF